MALSVTVIDETHADLHFVLVLGNVHSRIHDTLVLHLRICLLSNGLLQVAGQPVAGTHVVLPIKCQQLCLLVYCTALVHLDRKETCTPLIDSNGMVSCANYADRVQGTLDDLRLLA